MPFTAAEIARHLGGEVIGNQSLCLHGFAPADRAQPGDLTFAENDNYLIRAEQSSASAIIVSSASKKSTKVLISVPNARVAFARVLPLFFPEPSFEPGIHPSAVLDPEAKVDGSSHIGPNCVVSAGAIVGPRCVLQGGNFLGPKCRLGEQVHLFPNVVLYANTELGNRVRIHSNSTIGSDGFGYVPDKGTHLKVPQIGNVIVRDDVEIGANVTIDRGALGPTLIGKGTKIDNLVQIGHNVVIGEHCLLVSQVGIAGSTRMGNYVTIGGQAGIAGHLKIGNNVSIAAQAGVMTDIPDGEKWLGAPAQPDRKSKRQLIVIQRLPELLRRVHDLEKHLGVNRGPSEDPKP